MQARVLNSVTKSATMSSVDAESTYVLVERKELQHEHMVLLRRIHQIRKLLGYAPLPTGKIQRAMHSE